MQSSTRGPGPVLIIGLRIAHPENTSIDDASTNQLDLRIEIPLIAGAALEL